MLDSLPRTGTILIQCHDDPDADSLASGFALYEFFASRGRTVRLAYGGTRSIAKPDLQLMIEALGIPVEHAGRSGADHLGSVDILVTADCRPNGGNASTLCSPRCTAVIDHHPYAESEAPSAFDYEDVRPRVGSCSTIVWDLLRDAGFDVNARPRAATALYLGLYYDTNGFSELRHPLDRDMRDSLTIDARLFRKVVNSNFSLSDISRAGEALASPLVDSGRRIAVFQARPCDPNLLGFIGDIAIRTDGIDACVIFFTEASRVKFSVRSCVPEIPADEAAAAVAGAEGAGGGHSNKAGGYFLTREDPREIILKRLRRYIDDFDVLVCPDHGLDTRNLRLYIKKPLRTGYVPTTDLAPSGTAIIIRTMEGDIETVCEKDVLILVGVQGEAYPILREKFAASYRRGSETERPEEEKPLEALRPAEYPPTVRILETGRSLLLEPHIRPCVSTGRSAVYARELDRNTRVITSWDFSRYYSGRPGDFIAVREDDPGDCYIVNRDIFLATYRTC